MKVGATAVERYYGIAFRMILKGINTVKKRVYVNECEVHQFLNNQSLSIIYDKGLYSEYELLNYYIKDINGGAVWADQDFKSVGHFYNPVKQRGLYGHFDALHLSEKYYKIAIKSWKEERFNRAMFFLGASIHLIQDVTIPQHVNIRLLDKHKKFESYVKRVYKNSEEYRSSKSIINKNTVREYIDFNALNAININNKYAHIKDDDERFKIISKYAISMSQKTTAGCLLMFLRDIDFK